MKKRIAVVAIAALMAGSLTNVGAVSAAEPTEITFWHYMSEDKEKSASDKTEADNTIIHQPDGETVHHRCSFRRASRLWNGR